MKCVLYGIAAYLLMVILQKFYYSQGIDRMLHG